MSTNKMVVIGTSLGGLDALLAVLAPLPMDFPAPILVVRHQYFLADDYVVKLLDNACLLKVEFAKDKVKPVAGHVYLAPPDQHLLLDQAGQMVINQGAKVMHSRPSIDLLFKSAAPLLHSKLTAVILTGANEDGCDGAKQVKVNGGIVVVQDPDSAEAAIMPRAVIDAGMADHVVWLNQIGPFLWDRVRKGD